MYLILFDVDGTLVDSQHMIVEAMSRAFRGLGLSVPDREAILGVVGLSLVEAMERLVPEPGAPTLALAEGYRAAFQALRASGDHEEPLFPGARAAIERFHARSDVLLGVATGKSRRGVAAIVERHGLKGRFVTIQTADDHPSKPHPSMVLKALAETGVEPARAAIIGDSSYDMLMAGAAGIRALGVSWGYQSVADLRATGAETILDCWEDADPAVASLFSWD